MKKTEKQHSAMVAHEYANGIPIQAVSSNANGNATSRSVEEGRYPKPKDNGMCWLLVVPSIGP